MVNIPPCTMGNWEEISLFVVCYFARSHLTIGQVAIKVLKEIQDAEIHTMHRVRTSL